MALSRFAALLHLLVFAGVLAWIFAENRPCLLLGLDGQGWRIAIEEQAAFRAPFTQTGADPLQGSFDIYFPTFREYLAPDLVSMLATGGTAGRALTYLVYAVLLTVSTALLAASIGIGRGAAILGGMLVPLLTLPVFLAGAPLLFPIFPVNPHVAQTVALTVLMLACFWKLEDRSGFSELLLVVAPVCLTLWAALSEISITVLTVPPLAIFGVASLFSRLERRRVLPRLAAGALMVGVPAALGMVHYIYGLSAYTAFALFASDFQQFRANLMFASTVYWLNSAGIWMTAGGVLGALYALRADSRRLRLFAVTYLGTTAMFQLVAYAVVTWATTYQGPSPVYFEIFFWPLSAIFCGYVGFAALDRLARGAMLVFGRRGPVAGRVILHGGISVLALYLLASNLPALAAGEAKTCLNSSFSPIRPTPITDRLSAEIGARLDAPFRGVVATFTGYQDRSSVSWLNLFSNDAQIFAATGNDHRTVGLWKYHIPTLLQYSTYITPQYYLLFAGLLDRPQDQQMRSIVILTRPNLPILKLWGVRFLITDFNPGFGTIRVEMPVAHQAALRLVELADANMGNYSPTEIVHVDNFAAALAAMRKADFDGRRTVVAMTPLPEPLVPARDGGMTLEKYGLRVRAQSAGRSLLVLPVQYSHCWSASGKGDPHLFRADFAQLGVSFEHELDARLTFRYGPLLAGQCRMDDLADMNRFNIGSAPRALSLAAARPQ
jgi:hypothetical protein